MFHYVSGQVSYAAGVELAYELAYLGLVGNELAYLGLVGNELAREIPSQVGNLTNLTCLVLDLNSFTRPIPSSLNILQKLESLYMA